jgi:hypothetical protein
MAIECALFGVLDRGAVQAARIGGNCLVGRDNSRRNGGETGAPALNVPPGEKSATELGFVGQLSRGARLPRRSPRSLQS